MKLIAVVSVYTNSFKSVYTLNNNMQQQQKHVKTSNGDRKKVE